MHKIQHRILRLATDENIADLGYRKLGEKIKVNHPQQVKWHLQKLIADGHLQTTADGQLIIAKQQPNLAKLPILGAANCGQPLVMAEERIDEFLTLSKSLVPTKNREDLFVVKADGDSMNLANVDGDSIEDGDYVIIDASKKQPSVGDYVLASIEGLATIKRYAVDKTRELLALIPESSKSHLQSPIIVTQNEADSLIIHGQVVKVIKTPSF